MPDLAEARARRRMLFGQFFRFGCVGVVGFVIDAGVLMLVLGIAPGAYYLGRLLSYFMAASVAWWLNRRITFGGQGPYWWREWGRYLLANLSGGTANYLVYLVLIEIFPLCRLYPALAVLAGAVVGITFNFTASRRFVFGQGQS